jgi:hypothetical protein
MKLRMRLRQTGAVTPPGGRKALNVEHRTPNIERRIMISLRSAILNNKIERIRQSASVNRQSIIFSENLRSQGFFFD